MLTTLPLMSLCLAVAALLFINKTTIAPIVVFIYCAYPPAPAGRSTVSITMIFAANSICCGVLSQLGAYTIHTSIREFSAGTKRSCTLPDAEPRCQS